MGVINGVKWCCCNDVIVLQISCLGMMYVLPLSILSASIEETILISAAIATVQHLLSSEYSNDKHII